MIFRRIPISKEEMQEMVRLKEERMTDENIAKYFTQKGKEISTSTVGNILREYYDSKGKIKPSGKRTVKRERKIILTEEETRKLVELKEQRFTYKQISKYFKDQGRVVSDHILRGRLLEYYEEHGKPKPKRIRKYEDDLKEIIMSGMTIQEFISEFGQECQSKSLEEQFKKLRVIAEHSKKENDIWVPDNNFIRIIDFIQNPNDNFKRYQRNIEIYLLDGSLKVGAIDIIHDKVFGNENTELMVYCLSRADLKWEKSYNYRVYKILKGQYQRKVDKYLERLYNIENNRRKNKTNSENSGNSEIPGDER